MAKRILVVDDDKNLVKVLKVALSKAGYRVFIAYDGEQALKRIERVTPDLVILDVMMPGMDGIEVARYLLTFGGSRRIPIIFLSVKSNQEEVRRGYRAGADWYLGKPFNKEELLTAVGALLSPGYGKK